MYLVLENLRKMYDENNGVQEINLSIEKGEFITLLGPSGCGKTTILRMLGGYLLPDRGRIWLEGEDITYTLPEERPVSTVYQNYALFTGMNVEDNICYGLRHYHRMNKKDAREGAQKYIQLVGLQGYEKTAIHNLSGGQQQRVALARSMAIEPKVLLLDEPFSNLDAALRGKVRRDLKELQEQLKITMIFVTHDQEEALSLSDQIVVMNKGTVVQTGTPKEIYYQPAEGYVSEFIGGMNQAFGCRPEEMEMMEGGEDKIEAIAFLGSFTEYTVIHKGQRVLVKSSGQQRNWQIGQRVTLREKERTC